MHRGQISELRRTVNDLITEYLEVNDDVFATFWWRTILRNLFPIPFDKLAIKISQVEYGLGEVRRQLLELYKEGTPDVKTYLALLDQYIAALSTTVVALDRIVVGLKGKTEGKPYDISAYNADCAAYKDARNRYHVVGGEVNRKWRAHKSGLNEFDPLATEVALRSDATTTSQGSGQK
jgi:hypothetical protein